MQIQITVRQFLRLLMIPLSIMCFVWGIYLSVVYIRMDKKAFSQAYEQAQNTTHETAERINKETKLLEIVATDLADKLSKQSMTDEQIIAELKKKPVQVTGAGVAFAPEKRVYAPYYVEKDGVQQLVELEKMPKYVYHKEPWFVEPLTKGTYGPGPFFDQVSNNDVIEYAVPFFEPGATGDNKKPIGIVYATISMEHLQHLLTTLFQEQRGYWFLIGDSGVILTHPLKRILYSRTTMANLAHEVGKPEIDEMWRKSIETNKGSYISYNNEINGGSSWLFCEPIPAKGVAALCGVFINDEITLDRDSRRHDLIMIICILLFSFLGLVGALGTHLFARSNLKRWVLSLLNSVLIAIAIALIWAITAKYPQFGAQMRPIIDKVSLYQYLKSEEDPYATEAQKEEKRRMAVDPLASNRKQDDYVPTGIFIRYIRLVGETQIQIAGYVWQRYHDTFHAGITRGFLFPQATSDMRITKMYSAKQADETIIIWRVNVTLNQDIAYTQYPFDFKNLQIKLWHHDFEKNVTLIPDFNAYTLTNPTVLPGLHPEARLSGWQMEQSYFGYKKSIYKTSFGLYSTGPFGIYQRTSKEDTPELHFNIGASRLLTDTLISDLMPLAVIMLLLFIMILMLSELETSILSAAASLFFGAIFAQIRFRSKLPPYGVVYFEYFYFIIYIALFIIISMSIVEQVTIAVKEERYKNNIIAALWFWPAVLTAVLCATLLYLY